MKAATASRTSYTIMDGTEHETTVHVYDSGNRGLTTFVIGGMHGDETSGYLAADEIATWSVTTGKLVVIPRANVEAIQAGVRGVGYDLNRQFPRPAVTAHTRSPRPSGTRSSGTTPTGGSTCTPRTASTSPVTAASGRRCSPPGPPRPAVTARTPWTTSTPSSA
ncbi:succinylglutamate desuccinylase/aspartoacylase family protein [Halobacteriaceae archaeon GCM10025711]